MKAPCKDCPDRHYKCHSECDKYQAFDAYRKELNRKRLERSKEVEALLATSARVEALWRKANMK